jgi:ABC-type nitrate/sulfonate/bicarbonate transport system permease component
MGASRGLGYRIAVAQLAYKMDQMIAALLVLGLAAAITDQLIVLISRKVWPWLYLERGEV